ncbi:gliding motility lipoprotein GldH family protein [Flavobacterium pedocola]
MKAKAILFLSLLFVSVACDKSSVYSKLDTDFENNRWTTENVKTHEFTIEDASKTYNLNLKFSHVYGYPYESAPLLIKIVGPDGKEEQLPFNLKIKDANGKQLADCSGDFCDLISPIKENVKLLKGKYTVTLSNALKGPYLPDVLGVGLEVEAVK